MSTAEASPFSISAAYEKLGRWAEALDQTPKMDKRATFEAAAADIFEEMQRETDLAVYYAIKDDIGDLGREYAGLDSEDVDFVISGAEAAAKAATKVNGYRKTLPDEEPPTPSPDDYGVEQSPASTSKAPRAFPLVAFKDIRLDLKRSTYLVKRLLPRAGIAVIWGPPKCYKSFWAMDIALHIAAGWSYRGRRVQQAPVVYLGLEGQDGLPARKEALARHYRVDDVPFYLITTSLNLAKDANALVTSIEAQLCGIKPGAVFIDTLNRSLVGSESKDEDMSAYLAGAGAIRAHFGCLVPIVHHCGYDASRMRGHSSLPGAIDAQLRVDRTSDLRMAVTVVEAKDFAEGEEIACRLESVELGRDDDGDPVTSLIVLPDEEIGPQTAKRKSTKGLGSEQRNALKVLTECIADHGIAAPVSLDLPASIAKVVTLEVWKEQLFARGVLERGESKNWVSKWGRLRNKLVERGHVGILNEMAWPA